MRPKHMVIGINDEGDGLSMFVSDPGGADRPVGKLTLTDLDQELQFDATRKIGRIALDLLRISHPDVFAQYTNLMDPPEDSPPLADIDLAMALHSKSVRERTQAYVPTIGERAQVYVPVIDRLMRVDPAKRRSNHQFMERWPMRRAMIVEHFPVDE